MNTTAPASLTTEQRLALEIAQAEGWAIWVETKDGSRASSAWVTQPAVL